MPWHRTKDPYAIWISEVMLQQTRVAVAAPRFEAFLSRFPSVERLAAAGVDEVLAAWSGLGYYRRARNLQMAARRIVDLHGGIFPAERCAALALPGVGSYTAAAILSIAFDLPHAAVDGNARRVLARLRGSGSATRAELERDADRLLDPVRPGDSNQALMELGATVCLPAFPRCDACPLRRVCRSNGRGRETAEMRKGGRTPDWVETSIWVVRDGAGRIWLERRAEPPLAGLWMLPWRLSPVAPVPGAAERGIVRHAIVRRRYRCAIWDLGTGRKRPPGVAAGPGHWKRPEEIPDLPQPSLLKKALRIIAIADSNPPKGPIPLTTRRKPI